VGQKRQLHLIPMDDQVKIQAAVKNGYEREARHRLSADLKVWGRRPAVSSLLQTPRRAPPSTHGPPPPHPADAPLLGTEGLINRGCRIPD